MTPIERQLRNELEAVGASIAPILPPDEGLNLTIRLAERANPLTLFLTSDDDRESAGTVVDIMNCLWHAGDPPREWWATPLGQRCAVSLGTDDAWAWTQAIAAAHLDVEVGTIKQLVSRGTLARRTDGGLTPADVVRYGQARRKPR